MNINVYLICQDVDCNTFADSRESVLHAVKQAISELKSSPQAGRVDYYTTSLNSKIADQAGVKSAPTVLIIDADTNMLISRIGGNPISSASVKTKILEAVLQGYPGPGQNGDGIIPGGQPGGDLMGLGLFNLNWKVPTWLWLVLAGAATYKAVTSKHTRCKVVFGSAALVAGLNFWNKREV